MLEKIKVKLHNLKIWFIDNLGKGPECCGYFKNPDGRLVECSEWWGYQDCMFPGCGHYQIEHSDGTPNKILYSKDHPEEVGTEVVDPIGCLNAGCSDCPKFWTKEDLHNFVQQLSIARHHATHMMFYDGHGSQKDEVVKHVDTHVGITVYVTTTVDADDRGKLDAIFAREQAIMEKFPNVQFNFDVVYEHKPSDDVKTPAEDSIS